MSRILRDLPFIGSICDAGFSGRLCRLAARRLCEDVEEDGELGDISLLSLGWKDGLDDGPLDPVCSDGDTSRLDAGAGVDGGLGEHTRSGGEDSGLIGRPGGVDGMSNMLVLLQGIDVCRVGAIARTDIELESEGSLPRKESNKIPERLTQSSIWTC